MNLYYKQFLLDLSITHDWTSRPHTQYFTYIANRYLKKKKGKKNNKPTHFDMVIRLAVFRVTLNIVGKT